MSERVRILASPISHDYEVVIQPGILDQLYDHVPAAHTYVAIMDSNVMRLYGERVKHALEKTGAQFHLFEFRAGESSKTVRSWEALSGALLENGVGRDSCVLTIGGGVTTDLGGFVAATYMRGLPVVHVPTTLLAMIDAAIGGKTGVDTANGKNLIGAFHQPRAVLIDPHVLRSLPADELRYGLAEAIKHGAIADREYAEWIAGSASSIFEHRTHTLASLIDRSVEIKAKFVSDDVHEQGARAALNFGHTVGHGIEHASGYAVPHGHCIALGMLVEASAGEAAGQTEAGTSEKLRNMLMAVGLPTRVPAELKPDDVIAAMSSDKKKRAGVQRYSLIRRIGAVAREDEREWTCKLPDDVVKEAFIRASV